MNTMTYKGYIGSVAFSEKDNVFFGKVEGINGWVNFEGESVKELTDAFHEVVDDYLAYCEDEGIEPDMSYSGVLNVRLTPAIHRQIAILARQAGQTLNAYMVAALVFLICGGDFTWRRGFPWRGLFARPWAGPHPLRCNLRLIVPI